MPRTALAVAFALATVGLALSACQRKDATASDQLRAEIAALETEHEALKKQLRGVVPDDPRLRGMPQSDVRFGVPTSLARELIERIVTGFLDEVTLSLSNIQAKKQGEVKKGITIGAYDLHIFIHEIEGKLRTGAPDIRFGGDAIALALPITVASGTGRATVDFIWDGYNVAGAVCGDMKITEEVSGSVKPDSYPIQGELSLAATAREILASPSFPETRVHLVIEPSPESWATVKRISEEKEGLCGFVLDRVDIPGVVGGILAKGFDVKLPTEKLRPMAVPVSIQPTMTIRDKPITLDVEAGGLAITEKMIWLGANVAVTIP
jgi:hypothetical protein